MELALAPGGARVTSPADLKQQIVDAAEQLQHVASLALLSAEGDEPEIGADHILDGLEEMEDRLSALRQARQAAVPV